MTTVLLSHRCHATHGAAVAVAGVRPELIALPPDPAARLPDAECARAEIAFFSGDVFPDFTRQFFAAVRKAPRLRWMHVFNVGVDHPIFEEMLARGVRLTTSAGSTAVPIAQSAIMGLRVVAVRRGPRREDDPVDELHPPAALPGLLGRCDWLIVACPLTPETRGLIDADSLARLPRGARLINIARGEVVDEPALIAALKGGQLAGAYLDVFETEPLPPASPLWDMPNVLVTPHNSAAAAGNEQRVLELFLDNLGRWHHGAALLNEVPGPNPANLAIPSG